jgi:hypothetical protein
VHLTPVVSVLIGDDELREAGAIAIYDTPADLTADLDATALA